MTIKAILFDVDGTLVDSNEQHVTAWQEAFKTQGYDFDRAQIHEQIGKGGDNLVPALAPDATEQVSQAIEGRHGEIFKSRFLPDEKAFPGARPLLERTRRSGRKVVLATSASENELKRHMEVLEADGLVDSTTSKDDVGSSKPAPDIFSAALAKLDDVAPEEAVVIGDTPYDMQAARRCGIPALAVLSGGFSEQALREAGASQVFRDVAELHDRFDELFVSESRAQA